jgi:tRNA threonylcarbamoyladenosine biosynthesis protein TsaE
VAGLVGERGELTTGSPEETERVAARLATRLAPGDLVVLSGELGAGKTTFVRGAARALGVREAVTSPTFTIGHRYRGRVDVSHLDLYRLESFDEADWGALEPYLDDAVAFVEWPEVAASWLPPPRVALRLTHRADGGRAIAGESREKNLLAAMFGA